MKRAKGLRLVSRLAFCTCIYLGLYLGLGGRAWDYGSTILDPRSDFILAVICFAAVMALGRRVQSPVLIVTSAILAGSIQLLADGYWLATGWPEMVSVSVGLSVLMIWRLTADLEAGPSTKCGAVVVLVGGLAKVAAVLLPGFSFQGIYSLQFMLTWGLFSFGGAMLVGEAVRLISNRLR